MTNVELVSPGGVVTVHATDGSSWTARLSAGLITDATDGLLAEVEGHIELVPFASLQDKTEMLERLQGMSEAYITDEVIARLLRYVEAAPYYDA